MNTKKLLPVFVCLAVMLFALAGCNVSVSRPNSLYNGNKNCSLLKNNKKLSGTVDNYAVSSYSGLLGYGYNIVTGSYFNAGSVHRSYRVLNVSKLAKDNKILSIPITDTNVYQVTGTTVKDYESNLAGHAGVSTKSCFFKADFSTSFTSSTSISSTESFVKSLIHIGKKYEYVDLSSFDKFSDLLQYETPAFGNDINDDSVSPETLFDEYGTHVLLDIETGGRMELNYILPSEKAFAYKMKLEAIKKQGKRTDLTSGPLVQKLSVQVVADSTDESYKQIQRYIRLTELVPEILKMVDESKISFRPAVELSYLKPDEQKYLLEAMECENCTPSLSQAQRLKKMSQEGQFTKDTAFAILTEEKPNQKEQIRFPVERVRKYFPKNYTPKQMEETIEKLLSDWQRKRTQHDRDER